MLEVLRNRKKPLKLGYAVVKNRSQKQLNEKVPQKKHRHLENDWFNQHPHFKQLRGNLEVAVGTTALCTKLTKILVGHIKKYVTLPT